MHPVLRWSISNDWPYTVLRMAGALTGVTAPTARAGIAKCLAGQPTAVIVDVTDLRITDAGAAAVFAAAARDAAEWPAANLALCCADEAAAERLRRSAILRFVPVYPTLEAAVAGTNEIAPNQLTARLMPVVGAARQARGIITEACARWDLPALVGPACTVVTELVNNAVVHACTPMELVVRLRGHDVHISVSDDSPTPPDARGPAAPTAPGGRGLMMVEAVSQRWGWKPLGAGKAVWAVLRTDQTH